MSSILNDTKKILGIEAEYTAFDLDIITHINSALSTLTQLGLGPDEGMTIANESETWDTFFADSRLNSVKSYVYLRVRMLFDPPGTSYHMQAIQRQIEEFEWRLRSMQEYVDAETAETG